MSTRPGGWKPARLPDENVKSITALMRPFVEGHVNVAIEEFSPEMYTSQVVNGINYIIKVLTTPSIDKSCIHLHIYQPLPSKERPVAYQLTKIEEGQTLDSPIVPYTPIFPPLEPGPVIPPSDLPAFGPGPLLGGLTAAKVADAQVDAIAYQMRHAVELSTGVRYMEFKPIMFKTQVVAGVNYFIKILVDPVDANSCIVITVFQALPTEEVQLAYGLSNVQPSVTLDSSIVYETQVRPPPTQ